MPLTDQPETRRSGPLRVRNLEGNTTVFAKQIGGDPLRVTFAAKGHHGDTQRVPVALAEDIDFLNSLESGVLEIVDGPADIVESLKFETEKVRAEREEAKVKVAESLDRRQDRDIVGATCIGPAPTGRTGECGRPLIQSAQQQGNTPPLCAEHAPLVNNFYLAESGSKGRDATETRDGIVRREWKQVQMTAPQKQAQ